LLGTSLPLLARPSGQAAAFEPAGRRSVAPFAVRDHHRAG